MKRTLGIFLGLLLVIASLVGTATGARANTITLVLTQPFQYAVAGDTVSFDATVTADWANSGQVFLNSDNNGVDRPLTLDDSPFLDNFPLYLNPGDTAEATLFSVLVPSGTADGLYTGYFEIDGGADGNAVDSLASVDFNVLVEEGAPATAPEPSSLALLASAVTVLGCSRVRRKTGRA
ncbi:MAG TPA: PEP-CTERM sorting domain-containing protein [Bryobacteraceae bacterium]|nr:PEP-CTERM sorting domain-containing protein [Bryobacteraceae bacterium]